MKLSELNVGEKAYIVKVSGHGAFRKRIMEMGFVQGKSVVLLQKAPLQDPIKFLIMGYEVSMRLNETELIEVVTEKDILDKYRPNTQLPPAIMEREIKYIALKHRRELKIGLVGNPNCGKTTLFNYASGKNEHVGNYGGVTVESKQGKVHFKDYTLTIVDLPGTYSISSYSPEEQYVRDFIVNEHPDVIINVVDSTNLERNLYLTTQLLELQIPTVIALNFYDEFEKSGDILDEKLLGKLLGIPLVPLKAKIGWGIESLFDTALKIYEGTGLVDETGVLHEAVRVDEALEAYYHSKKIPHKHRTTERFANLEEGVEIMQTHYYKRINYDAEIETCITKLGENIRQDFSALSVKYGERYLAVKLLENDKVVEQLFANENSPILTQRDECVKRIFDLYHIDIESMITDARYGFIEGAIKETLHPNKKRPTVKISDKIDAILTHRIGAFPIFLLIMYIMFQSTFSLGQYPMDWIENGVGALSDWLNEIIPAGAAKDMLIDGVIGGVGGVIVFLPNILILYLFISILENTGYMARAAFIMDKLMHKIGLHGKSFIPLVMGFGCNVPAIMATRTIESRTSRMITILINPLMSCSARLPIYLLLAGTFFPNSAGLILFAIYITGILLAALLARLFRKFLFKYEDVPFVMELPPYRIPTIKSLWIQAWDKCMQYLKKMGTTILLGSIIIWFLGYFPQSNQTNNTTTSQTTQLEQSYIGQLGHAIQPILAPLNFDWKISVSLLTGIAAKEVVVSTLGVIYASDTGEDDTSGLATKLKNEKYQNGTPVYTPAVALSFMLFVLLYIPCLATVVAIKNETNTWSWATFSVGYGLVLAWGVAFAVKLLF